MEEHSLDSAIKLASNENPLRPAAVGARRHRPRRPPASTATPTTGPPPSGRRWPTASASRPTHVAVGCGSVGLLQQLLLAYADPGDEVLYAWRSFEAYPIYTAIVGATEVTTPCASTAST